MREREKQPFQPSADAPKLITADTVAETVAHITKHRVTYDVTAEVARSGEQKRFLRDAISDFRPLVTLIDAHPERFQVQLTAVVPPGEKVADVFYFALRVSIDGRDAGESHFLLNQNSQHNPSWAGVGHERERQPIDEARMAFLRRFLQDVQRSRGQDALSE